MIKRSSVLSNRSHGTTKRSQKTCFLPKTGKKAVNRDATLSGLKNVLDG
jgi:hypothetical protein